jgi:hypothetical protein
MMVSTAIGVNSGARRTKRVHTNAYNAVAPSITPKGIYTALRLVPTGAMYARATTMPTTETI